MLPMPCLRKPLHGNHEYLIVVFDRTEEHPYERQHDEGADQQHQCVPGESGDHAHHRYGPMVEPFGIDTHALHFLRHHARSLRLLYQNCSKVTARQMKNSISETVEA